MNETLIVIGIAFLIVLAFIAGIISGYNLHKQENKDTIVRLCEYSNGLTELVNLQADFVDKYMNKSLGHLENLDCEVFKR